MYELRIIYLSIVVNSCHFQGSEFVFLQTNISAQNCETQYTHTCKQQLQITSQSFSHRKLKSTAEIVSFQTDVCGQTCFFYPCLALASLRFHVYKSRTLYKLMYVVKRVPYIYVSPLYRCRPTYTQAGYYTSRCMLSNVFLLSMSGTCIVAVPQIFL
jgi:hypothetical protein